MVFFSSPGTRKRQELERLWRRTPGIWGRSSGQVRGGYKYGRVLHVIRLGGLICVSLSADIVLTQTAHSSPMNSIPFFCEFGSPQILVNHIAGPDFLRFWMSTFLAENNSVGILQSLKMCRWFYRICLHCMSKNLFLCFSKNSFFKKSVLWCCKHPESLIELWNIEKLWIKHAYYFFELRGGAVGQLDSILFPQKSSGRSFAAWATG